MDIYQYVSMMAIEIVYPTKSRQAIIWTNDTVR